MKRAHFSKKQTIRKLREVEVEERGRGREDRGAVSYVDLQAGEIAVQVDGPARVKLPHIHVKRDPRVAWGRVAEPRILELEPRLTNDEIGDALELERVIQVTLPSSAESKSYRLSIESVRI